MRAARRILLAGTLVLVSATAQAEKSRLAVLDLQDKGVGPEVASLLTSVASNRLSEIGIFQVISREDIKNMLSHQQDQILLGCVDESCLVQIGGALGAENLVAGAVGKVGEKYIIGLQRIDVRGAKVVKRVEREFEGSRDKLLYEVRNAAYKVVEDILVERSGRLILSVSEEGADVSVDGKTVGTSPLPGMEIPAGPRDLRVSKKGFVDWVRTVQVEPRQTRMEEVNLIPSAAFIEKYEGRTFSMRRWAWITLATFVALEAGAAGLRTYTFLQYDPIEDDYNQGNYGNLTQNEYYDKYKPDMDRAEIMDYAALSLAVAGVAVGIVSAYLFLEGEDPDRYERFRGVTVLPKTGVFSLNWEF
jgi:hypothetical protein